jgi:uncharacterized protein YsxB (DUF464 family)
MEIRVVKRRKPHAPTNYPPDLFVTDKYKTYVNIITSNDLIEICQYGLSPDYILACLDTFSFAVLVFDKKEELQGIATVRNIIDHYFIDIICSGASGQGTKIMSTIFEIAEANNVKTIKLSALYEVADYYKRFGFEIKDDNKEQKEYLMVRTTNSSKNTSKNKSKSRNKTLRSQNR